MIDTERYTLNTDIMESRRLADRIERETSAPVMPERCQCCSGGCAFEARSVQAKRQRRDDLMDHLRWVLSRTDARASPAFFEWWRRWGTFPAGAE